MSHYEIAIVLVKQTPWWLLVTMIYLLFRGAVMLRKSTTSIYHIGFIPVVLFLIALERLIRIYTMNLNLPLAIVWLCFIIGFIIIGIVIANLQKISIIGTTEKLLVFRGNPYNLIVILIAVVTYLYLHFQLSEYQLLAMFNVPMLYTTFAILGACCGLLTGQTIYCARRFKTTPFAQ